MQRTELTACIIYYALRGLGHMRGCMTIHPPLLHCLPDECMVRV